MSQSKEAPYNPYYDITKPPAGAEEFDEGAFTALGAIGINPGTPIFDKLHQRYMPSPDGKVQGK